MTYIGAWDGCSRAQTPLRAIRIIDDTGHLFRAPEILFEASDIGRDVFGHNIPNAHLIAALFECVENHDNLRFIETSEVVRVRPFDDRVEIGLDDGTTHTTRLLAAADGRHSISREAAGIEVKRWDYPQTAIVCNFTHTLGHDNISTEFHRRPGPFTTVPMGGTGIGDIGEGHVSRYMSSLVWVETPGEANRLKALDDKGYIAEMEVRLQGLLGSVTSIGPRAMFPLSGMTAHEFAKNRIALIGEAAHVVPPIGAQGLNLSFRDAAYLADCTLGVIALDANELKTGVLSASSISVEEKTDPGAPSVMDAYNDARRRDVSSRAWGIDLLNRALISEHYPMQFARGFGLHMLSALPALRHAAMRAGMTADGTPPSLMRDHG